MEGADESTELQRNPGSCWSDVHLDEKRRCQMAFEMKKLLTKISFWLTLAAPISQDIFYSFEQIVDVWNVRKYTNKIGREWTTFWKVAWSFWHLLRSHNYSLKKAREHTCYLQTAVIQINMCTRVT